MSLRSKHLLGQIFGSYSVLKRYSTNFAKKLVYSEYGDPLKVLKKQEEAVPEPKENEVLLKMLAAPVNPADINTIQGKYPLKPKLPAVAGNEGVGKVVKLGLGVKDLEEGDHVILLKDHKGTWQSYTVLRPDDVLKVPKELGLVEAATLLINPGTAFRMLRDFTNLKPGNTVLQNGANSACGQNVIQICRAWGINTVNIVRSRPNLQELKDYLTNLGATRILTPEELRTTDIFKSGEIEKPKLALNCVGGQNALEMLRHLQNGSTMVTYGGMSMEPVTVPTSALIFKDLRIKGFWMSHWSSLPENYPSKIEMFGEIISLMTSGELRGPACKMVNFDNYKEAIMNTMTVKGMIGQKFILDFGD